MSLDRTQYQYTEDLLRLEACRAASAPSLHRCATTITTPLLPAAWEKAFHHRAFSAYIVQGIRYGFHMGFDGGLCRVIGTAGNMLSAVQNPAPVDDYLVVKLATGRIAEVDGTGIVVSRFTKVGPAQLVAPEVIA